MSYFSSKKNEWFELANLNFSGTRTGGTDLNLPTVDTWTTLARFDNEAIDLGSVYYRSGIQTDGQLSNFVAAGGTSTVSLRVLAPDSNTGLNIFNTVVVGTDASQVSIVESLNEPARHIPVGSLLQGKVSGVELAEVTGTNNRMSLHFSFTHRGIDPQLTNLTSY
jgi:hypothetical protein